MSNRVIIHCIDSLSVGGTEILLRNTILSLPQFSHVVVYLRPPETLKNEITGEVEFVCLDFYKWKDLWKAVRQLRKTIRHYKPILVHSHLFYSSLISRLASNADTPLVTTLHSIFSIDAFEKNPLSVWAERLTLKRRHNLVSVSRFVLNDYLKYVPHKGRSFVLYNFLPLSGFRKRNHLPGDSSLKCLAVGGLKEAKNYPYLLRIFEILKNEAIELDIFGEGHLRKDLQRDIDNKKLNVRLKGQSNKIQDLLPEYDLFIQASDHEGFGLSVIEAMAQRLPVFISDIPVFHEITDQKAHFFSLDNPQSVAGQLKNLKNDPNLRGKYLNEAYEFVAATYNQQKYIDNLLGIYSEITRLDLTTLHAEEEQPASISK